MLRDVRSLGRWAADEIEQPRELRREREVDALVAALEIAAVRVTRVVEVVPERNTRVGDRRSLRAI